MAVGRTIKPEKSKLVPELWFVSCSSFSFKVGSSREHRDARNLNFQFFYPFDYGFAKHFQNILRFLWNRVWDKCWFDLGGPFRFHNWFFNKIAPVLNGLMFSIMIFDWKFKICRLLRSICLVWPNIIFIHYQIYLSFTYWQCSFDSNNDLNLISSIQLGL
jgi:hypothetical protein